MHGVLCPACMPLYICNNRRARLYSFFNPLWMGLNYGRLWIFLPSDQLSGSLCRTQVLVIRDFTTTCTCTCQHYYSIFMHSTCVHVHMYVHKYALCGYTRHLRTCWYAAIHVNRPSGISQATAIAVNRTQGDNVCASDI